MMSSTWSHIGFRTIREWKKSCGLKWAKQKIKGLMSAGASISTQSNPQLKMNAKCRTFYKNKDYHPQMMIKVACSSREKIS